jgi:hypothetical protein
MNELRTFEPNLAGGRGIVVDKQELNTVPLDFLNLLMKYWFCRKFCHFKFYY